MFWDNTYIFLIQVYKEHEIKHKPRTILHFPWCSGFSLFLLSSVAFDVASSSGMKTSLISPFSIFLSGLFTDKHLFLKLNKLVLHTFNFSFFKKTGLVFMIHPEKIYRERIFLIYVGGEDGVPQPDPTPKSINPSKFLFPPHQGLSPLLNKKFHVTTQQKRHV